MRTSYFLKTVKTRGLYGTIRTIMSGYVKVNKFIVFYKDLEKPFDCPLHDATIEFAKSSPGELGFLRNKGMDLPVQFYCDIIIKL